MSGRACKAIICANQLRSASGSMGDFVSAGLTTDDQNDEVIKITEKAIHDLNALADEIPDPE